MLKSAGSASGMGSVAVPTKGATVDTQKVKYAKTPGCHFGTEPGARERALHDDSPAFRQSSRLDGSYDASKRVMNSRRMFRGRNWPSKTQRSFERMRA